MAKSIAMITPLDIIKSATHTSTTFLGDVYIILRYLFNLFNHFLLLGKSSLNVAWATKK